MNEELNKAVETVVGEVIDKAPVKKFDKKKLEGSVATGLMVLGIWKAAELTVGLVKKVVKGKKVEVTENDEYLTVSEDEIVKEDKENQLKA